MIHDPSSIGRRLGAMLYEGLVVFAILIATFLFPQVVLSGFGLNLGGKLLWLHVFLVLGIYFIWCWLHGGQTLPMKTWKLRVVDQSGSPLRPLQAILRYMAAWPSICLFGIGIFWALFDREGLFLHDRIAGTRIDREQDSTTLSPPDHHDRGNKK
jgi:uncharacterized RDD family membrane protein YckC